MNWIKTLEHAKKQAEIQAKGKAELKPQHFRRLKEIWKDKYVEKSNSKLNALFEVTYSEHIKFQMQAENPLLKALKKDYNFYGNPIILGEKHGVRK